MWGLLGELPMAPDQAGIPLDYPPALVASSEPEVLQKTKMLQYLQTSMKFRGPTMPQRDRE
jgi:hypothetical protein